MDLDGENKAQMSFCCSRKFHSNCLSFESIEFYVPDLYVVEQRSFGVYDLFVIAYISSNRIFSDDLSAKYCKINTSFPYGFN